jgi:TetR/AcrR family transcriptional regulator, lmrAB and yxaGH operons repressor
MMIVIVKGNTGVNSVANESRERMVRSAASLIASRGVSATSFSDVVADSGAPRGSIYHHFPGGKEQLATEAVKWTSDRVVAYLRAGTEVTPVEVLQRFIALWRQVVLTSGGTSGCVVAGVALDTGADEGALMNVARETFRAWIEVLADQLENTGLPAARARAISIATLAGMEGALILCRAEGSVTPLDDVAQELLRLLPSKQGATAG